MNLADLPPPPPDSNLSVAAESDGVVITLRRERFAGVVEAGVLLTLALVVLLILLPNAVGPWFRDDSARDMWHHSGPFLFWLILPVGMLVHYGKQAYARADGAIFFISPTRFAVATTGIFRNRDCVWPREQLWHIAAWQGLRIATSDGQRTILLMERKTEEVVFVAEVARLLLNLNHEPPLGPNDLAVTYQGNFWNDPEDAVLHVEPGWLSLRHPLADSAHLRFRTGGSVFRCWWFNAAIPLSPDDLICRLETEGNCRLEIAPAQVLASKGSGGMPRIDLAPLGRVLTLSCDLNDCQATRLPDRSEDLRLTLRCDDPEALPRALARFWGNREA
jgi:hypothetical protein